MPEGAQEPEPPVRRRLCTDDATVEAMGLLLAKNPRGLDFEREELAGWFGAFDKYGGNGSDRPYWLETYDSGPRTIDRVKHPIPIKVPLQQRRGQWWNPARPPGGCILGGRTMGWPADSVITSPMPSPPTRPTRIANDGPVRSAFRRLLDVPDGRGCER